MANYITDYFLIDFNSKETLRHINDWALLDADKYKGLRGKVRFAKKIEDLFSYKAKMKRPVYCQVGSSGFGYYIPVTLYNPETFEQITVLAMADSGADMCVFSHKIAEAIGVNWKKGKKTKAFKGEKFAALYAYRVRLLMSVSRDKNVYEIEADILNEKRSANLVGMLGFFDHFEVIFNPKGSIKYKFS